MSPKRTSAPNLLLIFTDQQRADTIGALGNANIRTPHLDRLVGSGTSFTAAYTPSPVCVPARACLHYGVYPWKTRCFSNSDPMSRPEQHSFMERLADAGYRTHGIGKCHFVPDPNALRGFLTRETQEELPTTIGEDNYVTWLKESPLSWIRDPHGIRGEAVYLPQTSLLPESHHPSQWVGDRAVEFIGNQAPAHEPWFLFASFIHPHPPYAPPSPWDKLYRAPDLPDPYIPENYESRRPSKAETDLYHYNLEGPPNAAVWRLTRARYYSCISFVDRQIGRIVDKLEKTGQLDNTLVIFASDHGDMLGDLGMVGKGVMNEPAVAVPLICRWPGRFQQGAVSQLPVSLVDIGPTLLEAAGVPQPDSWDGTSLFDPDPNRVVFSQIYEGATTRVMALDRDWKYAYSAQDNCEELFARRGDPREAENLANTQRGKSELLRLKESLVSLLPPEDRDRYIDPATAEWRRWEQPSGTSAVKPTSRNCRHYPWADYYIAGVDSV